MTKPLQPEFIRTKIMDCDQVVVYRYVYDDKKIALSLQTHFTVNRVGPLSFTIEGCYVERHIEDNSPVEFFFYKKGNPFYINAVGISEIINCETYNWHTALTENRTFISFTIQSFELVTLGRTATFQENIDFFLTLARNKLLKMSKKYRLHNFSAIKIYNNSIRHVVWKYFFKYPFIRIQKQKEDPVAEGIENQN